MKNKFNSGIIILVVMLIVIAGVCVFNFKNYDLQPSIVSMNKNKTSDGFKASKNLPKEFKGKYIAQVYLEGTIEESNLDYSQHWILSTINKLKNDSNNVAIALYINSPGGGVYQADEVYLALQDYKTKGKKVYVYMGPVAASGGYYISCAADEIWANRNTLTGSIGVISGQFIDATELLDKVGVKISVTHSGKNKLMGNYFEPATQEQLDIMQAICNECYDQFCSIVATQRNMSFDKVYALADGRIYTANQALNNGLIDRIDNYENMLTELSESIAGDNKLLKTVQFQKEKKQSFMQMLLNSSVQLENSKAAAKLGLPTKIMENINSFNSFPAYLYQN